MTPCLFVLPLATTNPRGELRSCSDKPVYVKSNRGQGKFDTHLLQATETETMQISFALQDTKDSFYDPFSLRIDARPALVRNLARMCSSLELGHLLLPELLCLKPPPYWSRNISIDALLLHRGRVGVAVQAGISHHLVRLLRQFVDSPHHRLQRCVVGGRLRAPLGQDELIL